MTLIAGIGSRETPPEILSEMRHVGFWCSKKGVWLRSGHADGADWAFEEGAGKYCIAYLPWYGFNSHLKTKAHYVVQEGNREVAELSRKFHPRYDELSRGAKALMHRNAYQILGLELKEPVKAVVCWTKDGNASGGTGQAMRIAIAYGIPIRNMHNPKWNTAQKVQDSLAEILGV